MKARHQKSILNLPLTLLRNRYSEQSSLILLTRKSMGFFAHHKSAFLAVIMVKWFLAFVLFFFLFVSHRWLL